ncbi:protein kintoun [Aricia agestis]|uniref:protein kintoun n=1 Tax=Aricia agestis TaxID=91739 RepID=UPI001C209A7F|nr:protein kintoun [Aricia agestis]
MATGVKPRDDESSFSRADLEAIQDAMKNKKFRDLLSEYCDEVRDPANQAIYQKEMTQLEKERGYDVTFINPKEGYVIKTSVAGDRKAFINICSNTNVDKPSCKVQELNGKKGINWQLPYSIIPPREDYDKNKQRCVVYDVVFHPDTLRMAEVNKRFRELVNKTAFEGLQNTYNIHFDNNNCRFPKLNYKGMTTPAVIRKEDPNFVPPGADEDDAMTPELIEKLYPQKVYSEKSKSNEVDSESKHHKRRSKNNKEFSHSSEKGYTIPKYVIKQQKNVDLQDYTYDKHSKQYMAIPSHILVTVNLPLLTSTKDCMLDVKDRSLSLISEKPAKYKLNITLPYSVNDECGNAKFDKTKHVLTVTLPVIAEKVPSRTLKPLRADSGIDSENNSFDEEEETQKCLVEEIQSTTTDPSITATENTKEINNNEFLESTIGYILPSYTYNVLDDVIAFTFHVKNTDPSSVQVKKEDSKIYIKFSTVGSGFVQMYYAAIILFEDDVTFNDAIGEAWDNNVILQLELNGCLPKCFSIGLNEDMTEEIIESSQINKTIQETEKVEEKEKVAEDAPIVEVTNTGMETNILVSSKSNVEEEHKERKIVWVDSGHSENGAKSILRKPISIMRSYSESSTGDVASSMDYISSDCIPEESSLKKTVRFSNVIARQFYRFNSSIEAQKRKNQRKKNKKRSQERRKSESEAEEDTLVSIRSSAPRKTALKKRHDSGLADTSDAEGDCKYTMSDSEVAYEKMRNSQNTGLRKGSSELAIDDSEKKSKEWAKKLSKETSKKAKLPNKVNEKSCDNIKHNTNLYDPEKLNPGLYPEVKFKNDLIFDLDM